MRGFFLLSGAFVFCSIGTSLRAELKDYQIGRLIMLKSECLVIGLTRTEEKDGSWTYLGKCSNESFYPDGVRITCPEPANNDERTCVIHTRAKKFDNLRLLQQSANSSDEDIKP